MNLPRQHQHQQSTTHFQLPKCPICMDDFDTDLVVVKFTNDHSLPVSCFECTGVICYGCLAKQQLMQLQKKLNNDDHEQQYFHSSSTSKNNDNDDDWVSCPLCSAKGAFNVEQPHYNRPLAALLDEVKRSMGCMTTSKVPASPAQSKSISPPVTTGGCDPPAAAAERQKEVEGFYLAPKAGSAALAGVTKLSSKKKRNKNQSATLSSSSLPLPSSSSSASSSVSYSSLASTSPTVLRLLQGWQQRAEKAEENCAKAQDELARIKLNQNQQYSQWKQLQTIELRTIHQAQQSAWEEQKRVLSLDHKQELCQWQRRLADANRRAQETLKQQEESFQKERQKLQQRISTLVVSQQQQQQLQSKVQKPNRPKKKNTPTKKKQGFGDDTTTSTTLATTTPEQEATILQSLQDTLKEEKSRSVRLLQEQTKLRKVLEKERKKNARRTELEQQYLILKDKATQFVSKYWPKNKQQQQQQRTTTIVLLTTAILVPAFYHSINLKNKN